ncbi:MAG: LLM class flavin-dependent oxidoreductase [Cytophagales bacterium]|nr:LLM class flavin-dependent oxidoreductase [Cytophagales bacterium]
MQFGIHYLMSCAPDQQPARRYQDTIEQAVAAEALGFESVWPVEQHFNQELSALPCPTQLLAAIAARTRTLRLGTGIAQLGLHHPLRVAEEIATLDVLSGGRVEFGVGRGGNPAHFAGFNVPMSESRERMAESLAYLRLAFSGEKFSFGGRFFPGEDLCLVPQPVQQPGPPVTVAVNSADTALLAAREGYPIVIALHVSPLPKARELVRLYEDARREAGHPPHEGISLLLPLCVGEGEAAVRRAMAPAIGRFVHLTTSLLAASTHRMATEAERQSLRALCERLSQTTYDSMNGNMGVFGTADACVERLQHLAETLGVRRFIGWFNLVGAVPNDQALRSIERFSASVMPQFSEVGKLDG